MQHFTASDGARIAFTDQGSGRPLLLLHGLMAHGGFFRHQAALAARFRLIAVDLRGHGESRQPGETPDLAQLAGDISAIAAALDLRDAIGVGWSLGAAVLWHVLTGPESHRFAGAVVVDMTPRVLNDGAWQLGLSSEACDARSQAIAEDFASFAVNAGQAIFAQPVDERSRDTAQWAGEQFARNDPRAIGSLWSSLVEEDSRPLLGRIRQPTLIVHGAQSQLYGPETARHLADALPDARTLRFERSGHAPHIEEADLFNRAIADFAASLPRVRQSRAIA